MAACDAVLKNRAHWKSHFYSMTCISDTRLSLHYHSTVQHLWGKPGHKAFGFHGRAGESAMT
jgi:hypothetical protein